MFSVQPLKDKYLRGGNFYFILLSTSVAGKTIWRFKPTYVTWQIAFFWIWDLSSTEYLFCHDTLIKKMIKTLCKYIHWLWFLTALANTRTLKFNTLCFGRHVSAGGRVFLQKRDMVFYTNLHYLTHGSNP